MASSIAWAAAVVGLFGSAPADETAAEIITLKDGSVIRGQVLDPDDRGQLVLVARRDWLESELPEKAKAWQQAEAPWMRRAQDQRVARLEAWKRDIQAAPGGDRDANDALLRWIEAEVDRLKQPIDEDHLPYLMMTAVPRREVKSTKRQPPAVARLLRMGWRAKFPDVEQMAPDDLKLALGGRNFPVDGDDPVPLDDLLPMPIESDARWLARRAATEVAQDSSLRLVRYGDLVLPEGANMQGAGLEALGNISGLLDSLLGDKPAADPVAPKLRAVAARGRVGAVLTSLEIAPDFSGVKVTTLLLARMAPENWQPVATRSATVRPDELPADAGANIAADPQVQQVFGLVESLGLGGIDPEMKRRSLAIGSATQAALNRAKTAMQADLETLALPVGGR